MNSFPFQEKQNVFPLLSPLDSSFPNPLFYSLKIGLMVASAVNAAVELDLARHLETPKCLEDLAQETETHAPSLYLLLQALAGINIFQEIESVSHTFANTSLSQQLLPDAPESMVDAVRLWGAPYQWDSWRDLTYTIQTGKPALQKELGTDANIWSYLLEHPQKNISFQNGMTTVSNLVNPAILAVYDFSSKQSVIDVGGGHGTFCVQLLQHYPTLHVTLFERESIIEHVRQTSLQTLPDALATRYTLHAGNFLQEVPSGADCYLLKNVLMNWSDEEYVQILRCCHQAMDKQDARLLVTEAVISETSLCTKFFSLQMAMMMQAARQRTREEHQALFEAAGFTLSQVSAIGLEELLLEGTPLEA